MMMMIRPGWIILFYRVEEREWGVESWKIIAAIATHRTSLNLALYVTKMSSFG